MPESHHPVLAELLSRIRFALATPIDFRQTDTETTLAKVRLLTAAANYFNTIAVADFGGRPGSARAPGLVEQVVGAAFQTFAGEDPHADPFDRAALLLRGITQGHPFTDGNKRTGFLLAAYYLHLIGHPIPEQLPVDRVVDFCLAVSAGQIRDPAAISQELRQLWTAD